MIKNYFEDNVTYGKRAFYETENLKKQSQNINKYKYDFKTFSLNNINVINNQYIFETNFVSEYLTVVNLDIRLINTNLSDTAEIIFMLNDNKIKVFKLSNVNNKSFKFYSYKENNFKVMINNAGQSAIIDNMTILIAGNLVFNKRISRPDLMIINKDNSSDKLIVIKNNNNRSYLNEYENYVDFENGQGLLGVELPYYVLSYHVFNNQIYYLVRDGNNVLLCNSDFSSCVTVSDDIHSSYLLTNILISGSTYILVLKINDKKINYFVYGLGLNLMISQSENFDFMLGIKKVVGVNFAKNSSLFAVFLIDKSENISILIIKKDNFNTFSISLVAKIAEGFDAYSVSYEDKIILYTVNDFGVKSYEINVLNNNDNVLVKKTQTYDYLNVSYVFSDNKNNVFYLIDDKFVR